MSNDAAWLRPAMGLSTPQIDEVLGNRLFVKDAPKVLKPAAVLMLFSGTSLDDGEVVLTHRSPSMRSHSGQIAFPGGRLEEGETPVDAALREAWEETGLEADTTTVVEELDPVTIRVSGHPVSPVLAHWHAPMHLWPASPAETDDVFTASLRELLDPENRLTIGWGDWTGPAFWANGYLIWGFTGGLLSSLFAHAGWEEDWGRENRHDLRSVLRSSRNREKM